MLPCLFFSVPCDAHELHAIAGLEPLGVRIGKLVRYGAQAASSHDMQFSKGFTDRWSRDHATLSNRNVSEIIARANSAAATADAIASESGCSKNWNAPCPDGWTYDSSTAICHAAESQGRCSTLSASLSAAEKKQSSRDCLAPWPCQGSCSNYGRNYGATCPSGWIELSGGYCKVQDAVAVSRDCPSIGSFVALSTSQKQDLSSRCNVNWPCQTPCDSVNYGTTCPEHWLEVALSPGLCMAPPNYTGDCQFLVNTSGMNMDSKRAFATRCSVEFPCLRGSSAIAGRDAHPSNVNEPSNAMPANRAAALHGGAASTG